MAAAAVYATWPLGRFLGTRAPQNLGDPLLCAWMFGWGPRGLLRHGVHAFNAPIFTPERFALAMSENLLGMSLPFAPLTWLTGNSLLALNLALIVYLALGGYGTFLLVRRLTNDVPASILAGVLFAASPYRLAQIGHAHVVGIYLTPFILLLLLRLGDDDAAAAAVRRRVIGVGLLVALQFWASLTGGMISMIGVGAWGLWVLVARRRAAVRVLLRGALGAGIGIALTLPLLVPYIEVRRLHPDYEHSPNEALLFSAAPTSYLSPAEGGEIIEPVYQELQEEFPLPGGFWEKQLFPGFLAWIGLAMAAVMTVLAVIRRRTEDVRGMGLAAALLVVGSVFSLGPRWDAQANGFPLPFMVIQKVFGGLMRVPGRIGLLAVLGFAVATGIAFARLPRRARVPAFALAGLLLFAELTPSRFPVVPAPRKDAALAAVADRPGAVLALPTTELLPNGGIEMNSLIREASQMWLATAHYRPMVNGYMAYFPPSYLEVVGGVQAFPTAASLALLDRRDVRTIVVRTDMIPGTKWADVVGRLEAWPGVRTVATAANTRVYDITAAQAAAAAQALD